MSKLVIVESPAKAKTISRFLGSGYDVQASFGHVRDLPERADEIPAALKKEPWAKLGVNVEKDFEPLYVVPDDKKRHVDNLKKASKGIDELLLATDEDREGESISWHILQLLKMPKGTKVKRIVFHEITQEAITDALRHPRDLDEDLVRAQETRRILDRLYGYTLSPLLWKKVAPKLSAGRVQSIAVRLTVERERQRMKFHAAEYWDLEAELAAKNGSFKARLIRIDQQRVATGKSFDPDTGDLSDTKALLLKKEGAESLKSSAERAEPWKVSRLETTSGVENPPAPFMTSTLQQEANRKLRMSSKRTMQIAQQLYEGIDLKGERVGLITYMRTDSLTLSERALKEAREVISELYGKEYLPDKPVRHRSKVKGAQEAHEAIRPSDLARKPQDIRSFLDKEQFALYELIWKRTLACQMVAARVQRTNVEVSVLNGNQELVFSASGKQIVFPGFHRAYVEGSDDPEAELESKETILPALEEGQELKLKDLQALSHTTKPPARYTEASLVKKLEDEGIGRPSTYASIISTIQDRGYVFKRGNELVPTFTAFAVIELLENHFEDLVDLAFTARMEGELDDIAEGNRDSVRYLSDFYNGHDNKKGLAWQVEHEAQGIPFPAMPIGVDPLLELPVVVRVGRFGTFLQRGEGGKGHTATIPEDTAPAELTLESALEFLNRTASGPEAIGVDPASGQCVFARSGRYGNYLEVAQSEGDTAKGLKPKRITLPPGVEASSLSEEDLQSLLRFPIHLGKDPESGEDVLVSVGQYGAYIKSGASTRNIEDWRSALSLNLEGALGILSQPRPGRASGGTSSQPKSAIKEFGTLEGAEGPVKLMAGRYGPYVTDGSTNATLPRGQAPESLSSEEALRILLAKKAAEPSPKRGRKSAFAKRKPTGRARK